MRIFKLKLTYSLCDLQAKSEDGFVYDYYAAVADAQTEAEADLAHLPTVQVRVLLCNMAGHGK